jgi:hypothetical protein
MHVHVLVVATILGRMLSLPNMCLHIVAEIDTALSMGCVCLGQIAHHTCFICMHIYIYIYVLVKCALSMHVLLFFLRVSLFCLHVGCVAKINIP